MSKIIVPEIFLETKNSVTKPSSEIDFSTWLKAQNAFSNVEHEYILNISPKNNSKIKYSILAPNTFNHFKILGKLFLNIKNIETFSIDFSSSYFSMNNRTWQNRYNERYEIEERTDFLNNKELEITANNLDLNININREEYYDNETVYYNRDILPLETIIINCNQTRVSIQNQDIKKIIINNSDPHCFNLILQNLAKLEYLDISKVTRLDLKKFKNKQSYNYQQECQLPLFNDKTYYIKSTNNNPAYETCPINYFNINYINPECIIKLNSNLCFYFQASNPLINSDALQSIPSFPTPQLNDHWYCIYLTSIINCTNTKTIKIKWKTLQKRILLKINELIQDQINNDVKTVKKFYSKLNKKK